MQKTFQQAVTCSYILDGYVGMALCYHCHLVCADVLCRLVPSPHPFDFCEIKQMHGDIYNILVIGIILYYLCGDIIIYPLYYL